MKIQAAAKYADTSDYILSAVILYRSLVESEPKKVLYRTCLADNLRAIGRITEAQSVLSTLPFDNASAKARCFVELLKGHIITDLRTFTEAEMHYREALRLRPESTIPYVYLGDCLAKQERYHEALSVLHTGLEAEGDRDEVFLNIGNNYRALGDRKRCKEAYQNAVHIDPHYTKALSALEDIAFIEEFKINNPDFRETEW